MLSMNLRPLMPAAKWSSAFGVLAGIVLVYRYGFQVNPTTVALSFLLLILVLAAEWGLRYAVVISVAATACYNFFFLPPVGTFTIADPQNWLALLAFLVTSIVASRISQRARNQAASARSRQRELEILFRLSKQLLQSESAALLLSSTPAAVASVTGATAVLLFMLDGDRLYQAGDTRVSEIEVPRLRQQASTLAEVSIEHDCANVPVRTGVRPTGLLVLRGVLLSAEMAQAIGGLISVSIDRAQALENLAKGEAAKESERLRTLMLDSITHELRTPLTSIKGAATALLTGGPQQADNTRVLLTIIDEESDRLNKLISEAVEMAQLDAHEVQMHFHPVKVRELIERAREACPWVEEQHPVRVDIPADLAVRADPAFLQKAICNLLENAGKYSGRDAPITISGEEKDNQVAIRVADRGIGIQPAEQTLIFERFYRAHAAVASGTGMGLPIARAIVQAHSGDIKLISQPGSGAVFTIFLPSSGP
jgi:two-component system sensor histidine kinase KdpD